MGNLLIILILFGIGWSVLYVFSSDELRGGIGVNFVLSVVLINCAGFYAPGMPSFFAIVFLSFLLTARSRQAVISQYILLAGLVVQVTYGINITGHFLGYINSLVVLGLGACLVACSFDSPRAYIRIPTREDALICVTFLIMAIGQYGFSDIISFVRDISGQILLIVLPYLVLRNSVRSDIDYRNLMAFFGASAFLLSVFALYEAHYGWSIFEGINRHLGSDEVSKNILRRGSSLRAPATMSGPLPLACYLTVGIVALACSRSYFKQRYAYYAIIAVTVLGLLAAQSRGSLPALAAAVVVIFIARRRYGVAAAACVAALAGGLGLYAIAHVSPAVAAFLNIGQPKELGIYYDYRQLLFDRGIEEALRHPFLGMRLQPVLDALSDIQQGQHIVDLVNIYLVIFLISGLVGFAPFIVLLMASILGASFGFSGVGNRGLLTIREFSLAAMVVILLQFGFMSFMDRIPMNFVMIIVGLRLARIERSRQAARGDSSNDMLVDPIGQPGRITARALANRLAGHLT
jgi:hypothetical protein